MTNGSSPSNPEQLKAQAELELYRMWISRAADVCERAAAGDLEPRLLLIPTEGELRRLTVNINHLLDMTDAFVRESSASLTAAAEGRFHRRIILRGMLGAFRQASDTTNSAGGELKRKSMELRASEEHLAELASDLDHISKAVLTSSDLVHDTAESLASVARTNMESAQEVSGAADATTSGVQTVVAAIEELTG
jgi:methyl-accepting chemotaxis protein